MYFQLIKIFTLTYILYSFFIYRQTHIRNLLFQPYQAFFATRRMYVLFQTPVGNLCNKCLNQFHNWFTESLKRKNVSDGHRKSHYRINNISRIWKISQSNKIRIFSQGHPHLGYMHCFADSSASSRIHSNIKTIDFYLLLYVLNIICI